MVDLNVANAGASGGLTECITRLGANLVLMQAANDEDQKRRESALASMLSAPYQKLFDDIQDTILGPNGLVSEIEQMIGFYFPGNMEEFLDQLRNDPLRLAGVFNNVETTMQQFKSHGINKGREVWQSVENLIKSLMYFKPDNIISIIAFGIQYGVAAVELQEELLDQLEKLTFKIEREVAAGGIPDQVDPINPFLEALENLCRAKEDFTTVREKLLGNRGDDTSFDKTYCKKGVGHLEDAFRVLEDGRNSEDFIERNILGQLGFESLEQLKDRKWLPNYKVKLTSEAALALARPLGHTNNIIYTLHKNITGAIQALQFNFGLEGFLAIGIQFIIKEIGRIQNLLLDATGDPTGRIRQLENVQRQKINLQLSESSAGRKEQLRLEILQIEASLKALYQQARDIGSDLSKATSGSILKTIMVQIEALVQIGILTVLARAICEAFSRIEQVLGLVGNLNPDNLFGQINEILSQFDLDECPKFEGNNVLCDLGRLLQSVNDRIALKNNDDNKILFQGRKLRESIRGQKRYLSCFKSKLGLANDDIRTLMLALGIAMNIASLASGQMTFGSLLKMFGLDFDWLFEQDNAGSFLEAILRALICIAENCDNPGIISFVNRLTVQIQADKDIESTKTADTVHMAKEAEFENSFRGSSRLNAIRRLLSMLSNLGFCISGFNDPNRDSQGDSERKTGNFDVSAVFCNPWGGSDTRPAPENSSYVGTEDAARRVADV